MSAVPTSLDPRTILAPITAMMRTGRVGAALTELRAMEATHFNDAILLQHIAEHLMFGQQNAEAVRVYRRAVALRPQDPSALYNLATALIAVGETKEAESLLDRVIALDIHDYDAYQNRSTLRRQTRDSNHVVALEALIHGRGAGRGEVQLGYALSKELEDLGDWQRSFHYLKRGADHRRRRMSYDVEADIDTMRAIAGTFDATWLNDGRTGHDNPAPIFVMGLPRSGTTLIDRIISSHDSVQSLGEINDFALSLVRLAEGTAGKIDLVKAARDIDPAALGAAYVSSAQGYGVTRAHFIDKTPANYLYIGLILKALPNAKIVHLRRDAMDNGYALYKTLFRMGCPYSYDLTDIGRYMLAHDTLMSHWRTIAPGRIFDIHYEDMVADCAGETRRLIAALGLDWQDACLNFHENRQAAATASAAQVRQPVYNTSVGLWRRYESELAPLADILRKGGLV
ncbi:MAG: sulfotransferase [Asticcacaulis sp.]|nr:sulfotransferase [Asticcacaulis sp.]